MHKIVVTANNKRNERFLVSLLKKFDFIRFEKIDEKKIPTPKKIGDWSDLFGLWRDKDITLEKIRERAWPKRR